MTLLYSRESLNATRSEVRRRQPRLNGLELGFFSCRGFTLAANE